MSKALVPCRQFSGNFVARAPVSNVHYVTLQFPLLLHAWNMCVPTIQAKWRTFPMTISCHSLLVQTQPFLFYQFVDVYHAVAAFGLSNIVTNFVTLCFYFLIAMYMYILCICPLGHCHNKFCTRARARWRVLLSTTWILKNGTSSGAGAGSLFWGALYASNQVPSLPSLALPCPLPPRPPALILDHGQNPRSRYRPKRLNQ